MPRQDAKRRKLLVGGGDLLALAAQVVGVEARDDPDVPGVVADRHVLVAEVPRGGRHLEDGRLAVRPRRVAVEIAAHVAQLDERRRRPAERFLAQLGRAPRHAERRVDALLVGGGRQRLERLDVGRRPGGAEELRPEAPGLRDDELHRQPFDGDAEGAALLALDDGDDRRQAFERVEDGLRPRRRHHDGELERRVGPAAGVACDLAAERARDLLHEPSRTVQEQPPPPRPLGALEPRQHALLGLRPDARHVPEPSLARGPAELVGRAHVERAPELDHPLRPDPEEAAEADELRPHLAVQLVQLRDPAGLDQLAESPGDARPDAAQLLHPALAHQRRDGRLRLADRLRSAAVCPGRVVPGARELEQRGERFQAVGDRGVVGCGVDVLAHPFGIVRTGKMWPCTTPRRLQTAVRGTLTR